MTSLTLAVARLGQRGEGVAEHDGSPVYVPYALPGETVLADLDGDTGHIVTMLTPRPDRIAPICPVFGECGGCAVQALPPEPYAAWKRDLVVDVLAKAGVAADVAPLVDAHGAGRRRATVHARQQPSPNLLARQAMRVGFMRARAHEIVDIDHCPILARSMAGALPAARALANAVGGLGKPLDLVVTATRGGLDIDLRGLGPLDDDLSRRLVELAGRLDLARLANHGTVLIERRIPALVMGGATLSIPPGAFLQATQAGENTLAALVIAGVGQAKRVADLFCGVGTFALRLAESATVQAVDTEGPALAALARASRDAPKLRPVTTLSRDLFRRPLSADDLARFDAVVFDPPRAGAMAQAEALATSAVPTIVAVSCNPATFARDAAILIAGGYTLGPVTPVDQFRYAPHVELVATFQRPKRRKARALLG